MKPPPLLLGATLLFWGWRVELLVVGAVLAVVLEGARFIRTRWEFSEQDFKRIWAFCSVLMLAATVYAFTANEGPANFSVLFQNPSSANQGNAGASSVRTAGAMLRWLPMTFFLFVVAQAYSTRETIPLAAISIILQRRRNKAKQRSEPVAAERNVHIGYPYFAVCLLGASLHPAENTQFFWGLCALLTWALWAQRSRRFGFSVWAGALAATVALGYFGQEGMSQVQGYLASLNPEWIMRLRFTRTGSDPAKTRTALGRVGELKLSQRIVVRLEPLAGSAPPAYLREASYRVFKSPAWSAGRSLERFEAALEAPPLNSSVWPLVPDKTNTAAVRIASYLEEQKQTECVGLLPLPSGSGQLEKLLAFTLETNRAGAVLVTGPGLVIFDALYGPGATMDSPADANTNADLAVPDDEVPALDQVIAELGLQAQSPPEVLQTLSTFFTRKFAYRTWQETSHARGTNDTPLGHFLLETRAGHCEYFATATTLLLRQLNIPARYAVGYAVHEPSGRKYVVRLSDAHAWCLVWDDQTKQWQDFDTTPASWLEVESKPASLARWFVDAWSRLHFEWSKIWWGQTPFRQYLLWSLAPILALLFYQIFFRSGRRRQRARKRETEGALVWPGLDSEFYQLERKLAERGVARQPGEPLADWLERAVAVPNLADLGEPLRGLLRLHYRYRFDPHGLGMAERTTLTRGAKTCLESLAAARPTGRSPEG